MNQPGNVKLSQAYIPQDYPKKVLKTISIVFIFVVTVNILIQFSNIVQSDHWLILGLWSLTLVCLIAAASSERFLSLPTRTSLLLAGIYLVSITNFFVNGYSSHADLWFVSLIFFTTVLLSFQTGIMIALFSSITYVLLLLLGFNGINRTSLGPALSLPDEALLFALTTSFTFSLIGLGLGGVFQLFISHTRKRAVQQEESLSQVQQDRDAYKSQLENLTKREIQIRTAAEVSRALSAELDPDQIFQRAVDLIANRFDLYYVGIFTLSSDKQFAILQAGSGEAGRLMLQENHRLLVGGSSMIGWATSNREPRIALDVGEDAIRFENPHLPETRSELALPMVSGNNILGAMTIQSTEKEAFDEDDITVLQGLADSLSTALINSNLFQEVQKNLQEISTLHKQYLERTWKDIIRAGAVDSYIYKDDTNQDPPEKLANFDLPITLRDHQIGDLNIEVEESKIGQEERQYIETVIAQAALALENMRLLNETQKSAEHDRIIAEITRNIWTSTNLETILQIAIRDLSDSLGADEGWIHVGVAKQAGN